MAAPRKWSDKVRAAIHTHVNEDGRAATDVAPLLEAQGLPIPPLETIRDIARATRETITDKSKPQQLKELTGLAVTVIHAGFTRIQAENADSDADEILKLVRSLRELEPLLTDTPKGNKDQKPQSLLGGLHSDSDTQRTAKQDAPAALRSLSA